jgi:AbrB family looped-hinge helix DNA binding protein
MQTLQFEDMVRVMERGQVTIPLKLREFFNMQKGLRLWIRVDKDNKITLEPVQEDKRAKLKSFLEKAAKDTHAYWTKEDDKNLALVNKNTEKRLNAHKW